GRARDRARDGCRRHDRGGRAALERARAHPGKGVRAAPADRGRSVAANAQANLMRDWAKFTGGFYTRFASQGDAEAMLRRIRAWLRQPASYAFTATVDTRAPEPGKLLVRRAASASTDPTAGAAV